MKIYKTNEIKNIALLGAKGSGKTTLAESMVYECGVTKRRGTIEAGNTMSDYFPVEKEYGYSVFSTVFNAEFNGKKLNFIDCPGAEDFVGNAYTALGVCDLGLIVVNTGYGVEVGTQNIFRTTAALNKPVVFALNQMDAEKADYDNVLEQLRETFGQHVVQIQYPLESGPGFHSMIDVLLMKKYEWGPDGGVPVISEIPEEQMERANELHNALVEAAAENDELLLDKYFYEGKLSKDDVVHGIRKGIATGSIFPVMAGSALQNRGVINLLDEIVRYMPTANERKNSLATDLDADEITNVECEEDGPFAAQVFKTVYDPYTGKLNYIKIFRGRLKSGMTVYNPNSGVEERIGQIFVLRGKKAELVNELTAGDIGAVNKLTATDTGNTLCAVGTKIIFDPIRFPRPCLSLAVKSANKGEEDKMFAGFSKMLEEDYTFSIDKSADTGELILSGQGEIHLEVLAKKLKARGGIDVKLTEPRIPYRETIKKIASAEGKHKKQSGGHGQYGHCKVRFEPCESPFEFGDEVVGGAVPKQYIPAVEKGLKECMARGVLAGYPVTGVKAVLYDGSYHDVDSSEMAFKAAAALAFKEGMKNADPVLLEPVMKLKVAVNGEYLGGVMGDISKRRGRISDSRTDGDITTVIAEVPLSEIAKYATDLRGLTRGQGRFTSELLRYEEVPPQLAEKIISASKTE